MRYPFTVLPLLAVLALAPMESAGAAAREDEAAIRKTVDSYIAAFEKGDVDGALAAWSSDADYTDATGKSYQGRDKIAALFKGVFADLKGYKLNMKITSIKFLGADAAVEDGVLQLTSPEQESRASRYVAVWSKTGDKWQIRSVRDLPNEPATEPTPAAEQLKQLAWMLGRWSHKGDAVSAAINCHFALTESFLVHDYTLSPKDGDPFQVTQFIGWDPRNDRLRSWYFDSRGSFGEGEWTRSGNTWTIQSSGTLPDGRGASSTNSWTFVDDQTCVWKSINREIDGQPVADSEVEFKKQPAAGDAAARQ